MSKKLIFALLISICSCDDEIPNLKLPDKTQEGLNTLGFIIDDKVWTNYGTRCTYAGCEENKVTATLDRYRIDTKDHFELILYAGYTIRGREIDQSFLISCIDITESGIYNLDNDIDNKMIFTASLYNQSFKEYINTISINATLQITKFDTINNIVSGEFEGLLENPISLSQKVKIEKGRFDIKLDYRK